MRTNARLEAIPVTWEFQCVSKPRGPSLASVLFGINRSQNTRAKVGRLKEGRQTGRETDRSTNTHMHVDRHRQTNIQTHRPAQMDRQADRQRDCQTNGQAAKRVRGQTDKLQTDR